MNCPLSSALNDGSERFESQRNESVGGSSLKSAAPSAAAAAVDDVVGRCDTAWVSVTMTSQVIHLSACHGISVNPPGNLVLGDELASYSTA